MSLSICPRCALSLVNTYRMSTRTRLLTIRLLRRNSSSVQQQEPRVPVQPSKSIQSILQSLDPLLQASLTSFPLNSILAPYKTFTLSERFVQPCDPEVVALLQAVANKKDNEWWALYTQLSLTGGLKRLKQTHFSLILRALHPVDFHLNTGLAFSDDFLRRVARVKGDMENCGYYLGHAEWNHLLDVSRAAYRPDQTQKWWDEMIRGGVYPDTFSYNNYLNSLCGKASHLQWERPLKFKIDENGNLLTLGKSPSKSFHTYQRFPSSGKSIIATHIVQQMVRTGVSPNAATYEALIVAFGRDNDLDTVNDIIRQVWGFNPDGTPTREPPVTPYDIGSSLWPTEHTLNAIANAYGYNGSLAAAIALVESISSKYKIKIPVATWLSLLLWTSRRSTLYRRPRLGFISPLAAPRLFNVMTSWPYEISPGIEAYWHIINHERKRRARGSVERYLVDMLKRYGPNGTDLTEENQHLAWRVLSGVKNWIPILCDGLSRNGERDRAVALFRRWQHRFHALETTGLLRVWDEIENDTKSNVPGIILPSTSKNRTSFSIRKRLAKATAKQRAIQYQVIRKRRMEHYPARWRGPGRPLFLPFGINIQFGLGSPSRRYRRSHALWQKHVQGSFTNSTVGRDKAAAKRTREWRRRSRMTRNKDREEQKRIMGLKSGYLTMKREFRFIRKTGYDFSNRIKPKQIWRRRTPEENKRSSEAETKRGRFGLRDEVLKKLKETEVVPKFNSEMRGNQYEDELSRIKDMDVNTLIMPELRNKPATDTNYAAFLEENHQRKAYEKMKTFLNNETT